MREYKIKIEEIKSTEFLVRANNKKEARMMIEEIVYNTCILNLSCFKHNKKLNIVVNSSNKNNEKFLEEQFFSQTRFFIRK